MNIVIVSPEYYIPTRSSGGGLGVYIRKTAAALEGRGHRICVVVLSDREKRWCDGAVSVHEILRSRFFRLRRIPKIGGLLSDCFALLYDRWKIRKAVLRLYASRPIDIIHVASYGFTGIFLPRALPTVCRLSSITRLLTIAYGRQQYPLDKTCEWLEGVQVRRADAVFSPSRYIADLAKKEFGIDATVIRTMPLDPRLEAVNPSFYQANLADKRYLLYFGQMSRIKGTDILGDSLQDILCSLPQIHMVFIGRDDGLPNGMRCKDYVFSVLSSELHERVHFYGPLEHASLIPCIQNCQAVLMPSRIDNLPNACIEALACGIPVIASNGSSIEELVQDGITGFLFENGNAEALRDTVVKYLSLSPDGMHFIRTSIADWFYNYRKQDMITVLEEFYEKTLRKA